MDIRILAPGEISTWDAWVQKHPQGSLWQSMEWKKYQEALGRETRVYAAFQGQEMAAAALVVIDKTTGGFSTWDIAKGPMSRDSESSATLMERIVTDAKQDRCMSLTFSPDSSLAMPTARFAVRASNRCEQSPATRILDLTKSHDDILAQMHQKGRYNIRVAERHGVTIERGTSDDVDAFYNLLRATSKRDIFTISPKSHYARFLHDLDRNFFLIAKHENKPVAALLGVIWNGTGYYYYGASDHAKRALMAPYLLQWEAMKICKEHGCERYDLLGIAPAGSGPEHEWAGISSFKEKFGGNVIEYPQEQQVTIRPFIWNLLQLKRKFF